MGNNDFVLETKLRNEINELKAITFIIKCKYCYQVSSSFLYDVSARFEYLKII